MRRGDQCAGCAREHCAGVIPGEQGWRAICPAGGAHDRERDAWIRRKATRAAERERAAEAARAEAEEKARQQDQDHSSDDGSSDE